jgi:transposase
MLKLPVSIRVFVATSPTGTHAEVDVLVRRVRDEIGVDPFSGDLFCFFNRRRDRVKLLVWDCNGFWILAKRIERGRFEGFDTRKRCIEISREQLVMLLSGIDTRTSRFRRHFAHEVRIHSRDACGQFERSTK